MIDIKNVTKRFGDFTVLDRCNTSVRKGEVVVICGPSGSGKSTLIRCVNGLEPISDGAITVDGIPVGHGSQLRSIRRKVGMVFQHFELFPHLSIMENVVMAQRLVLQRDDETSRAKAIALLTRIGLRAHADKFPGQLSGGQQQRVAIVRALSMDPQGILFDEPTSALDPEMVSEVLDLLGELAAEGMTMMIVTHEMGFARRVSDRVVFMDHGSIVEDVSKDEFFDAPRSDRARDFLTRVIRH
ncbi:amino acid ABC transporter ATP-binding protein [Bordetella genomosp. 10]|uniref:amino acid ABC transporter ATP-binding protein n=1 Tax=Bordetella genomosp. 10 TaxID=1416804 RepID=UPI000B9EEC2E|nr:amino acid ABC transporter ATP-binding protein [Bordetella genomosp. 10]